jgi:site-specific recombinase XerD
MFENFLPDRAAVERLREGPFGPHLDSFVATLCELGYTRQTVRARLWILDHLGRWLRRHCLELPDLQEQTVNLFLAQRRREGRLRKGNAWATRHFLEHLRQQGAVPSPEPALDESPLGTLRRQYQSHLQKQRGLVAVTVAEYWRFARRLLVERFGDAPIRVRDLTPDDISSFVLRPARSGSPGVAKLMVTALRSFLRFLFLDGQTQSDLTGAVPTVPDWRLAELPKYLTPQEVERVVRAASERDAPVARRDHAILLLLARLGLRAGEVVALELDDVDWRAGELEVRGNKGGRHHDRLPLPVDVGEAIAGYLRHDRPPCTTRRLFVRAKAPHRGFANPSSVSTIVCRAMNRAGLQHDYKGAHVLRHSLATGMLRAGASLEEIGEVLRHRSAATTEIYAKVDVNGLRSLGLPWPTKGGEQ